MKDLRSQLDLEMQRLADAELTSQVNRSFAELIETGRKLTQHNFLVNAGGAAAVLAYMGSGQGAGFSAWALACFLIGVIASGVELRFLTKFFMALHDNALYRRSEFAQDKLSLSVAVPPADIGGWASMVHAWAGVTAQLAFPVGVALGLVFYFR